MNQWGADEPRTRTAPGAETDGRRPEKLISEVWEWIKSIVLALVIVTIIHTFAFNLSTVKGHSMEPTLQDREWLFINKFGYVIGSPKRGDIVILKDPEEKLGFRQYLVKRVVALPGERVEISGQRLYVNGEPLSEPYTDSPIMDGDFGPVVVPEGHYFVMGDNRRFMASTDSRTFQAVPEKLIKGKAQFVLWPLHRIGGLYDDMPEELP